MRLGVIVGRFQVDKLTQGHEHLMYHALGYDKVLIIFGKSPVLNTRKNPLSDYCAQQAVGDFLNSRCSGVTDKVYFESLDDCSGDDVWSQNLDKIIENHLIHGMNATLIGGRDSFIEAYSGRFETKTIEEYGPVSGTERRKEVACASRSTEDFRAGVIWAAYNRFPVVYSTVDVIPYDRETKQILVGRKKDETLWRFIGGFVDVDDFTLTDAACRELFEETKITRDEVDMNYICSLQVQDWRYVGDVDKVMTHVFTCDVSSDIDCQANDDIEDLIWITVEHLKNSEFGCELIPSHKNILGKFIDWLDDNE